MLKFNVNKNSNELKLLQVVNFINCSNFQLPVLATVLLSVAVQTYKFEKNKN